jgi:hypothetical protein
MLSSKHKRYPGSLSGGGDSIAQATWIQGRCHNFLQKVRPGKGSIAFPSVSSTTLNPHSADLVCLMLSKTRHDKSKCHPYYCQNDGPDRTFLAVRFG